jgi:hypothetical protein
VGNDRRQRKNQADEEKSLLHIITLLLFHNQLITHPKIPQSKAGLWSF